MTLVDEHNLKLMTVALDHYGSCRINYNVEKLGICKYCVKIAQVLVAAQTELDGDME